ncbi:MAG TPA: hypothetical protein VI197_12575 [Polyangiaceae bacterium]
MLASVAIKALAALCLLAAVFAFRASRRVGNGLLPRRRSWRHVWYESLFYPLGFGSSAATLALAFTNGGWKSIRLTVIVGGGLFAVLWLCYLLTRVFFAKIAFRVMDLQRAFAEKRGLEYSDVGPEHQESFETGLRQSRGAVRWADGRWLGLVQVTAGEFGERTSTQKVRQELPVLAPVTAPERWNHQPIGGFLGKVLQAEAEALRDYGRVGWIGLEHDKLVLLGQLYRTPEDVEAFVSLGERLASEVHRQAHARGEVERGGASPTAQGSSIGKRHELGS